jgi:hypothetical protein
MSVIARFSIPTEQFVFGDVLGNEGGIPVRLETMIPTGDSVIPYLWVPSEKARAVETALRRSSFVEDARLVDEIGPEALIRVEWSPDLNGLIDLIGDSEAAVLEAEGASSDWSFRMRFPDHRALSEFYRACVDAGITPRLEEINNRLGSAGDAGIDLTESQRAALTAALEAGYFDVPRRITLQDLADQFDISDTALSQRLRRGLTTLLTSTLFRRTSTDGDDD